jgi:hypothetical protein
MKKIIRNKMYIGGTILLLAASAAFADDATNNLTLGGDRPVSHDQPEFYRANELSFDGFGTAALGKYTLDHVSGDRVRHNVRFGAGAGVNYFFTRFFGIGLDAFSENTTGPFIDSAEANLILRVPLGQSRFAPYVFAGGGHTFDSVKASFGQAGAGMECRITPHVGVFIDGRAVVPDRTRYYGVARLGMRLAF